MGGFRSFVKKNKVSATGALTAVLFLLMLVLLTVLPVTGQLTAFATAQQDEISASKQKISDNKKKMEEIQIDIAHKKAEQGTQPLQEAVNEAVAEEVVLKEEIAEEIYDENK